MSSVIAISFNMRSRLGLNVNQRAQVERFAQKGLELRYVRVRDRHGNWATAVEVTPLASAATPLEDDLDNSESEDDPSKNEGKGRSKDKDPLSYEGKGTEQSAVADIEAFIEEEVSKGLAMLNEGDDAMRTNLRVAYDRYVLGLQSLLSLDKSHPKVIALKQKIAKYVTSAEIVYEALKVKKKPAKAVAGLTAGAASTKVAGEVKVKKKPLVSTEAMKLKA